MKVGRPRQFDTEKALDAAMDVFWRQGYQGASLADLTEAMGINRPSLYAAFGNKEQLYRLVLDRYAAGPARYLKDALLQPTAREVVSHYLRGAIANCTSGPGGCLWVRGSQSCGNPGDPLRERSEAEARSAYSALLQRLERGQAEGDLSASADCEALASLITTVATGIGVWGGQGIPADQLLRAAAAVEGML